MKTVRRSGALIIEYKAHVTKCTELNTYRNSPRNVQLFEFFTGQREHGRKTEHFKSLLNDHHTSALADHITSTGHNLKSGIILKFKLKGSPTFIVK